MRKNAMYVLATQAKRNIAFSFQHSKNDRMIVGAIKPYSKVTSIIKSKPMKFSSSRSNQIHMMSVAPGITTKYYKKAPFLVLSAGLTTASFDNSQEQSKEVTEEIDDELKEKAEKLCKEAEFTEEEKALLEEFVDAITWKARVPFALYKKLRGRGFGTKEEHEFVKKQEEQERASVIKLLAPVDHHKIIGYIRQMTELFDTPDDKFELPDKYDDESLHRAQKQLSDLKTLCKLCTKRTKGNNDR